MFPNGYLTLEINLKSKNLYKYNDEILKYIFLILNMFESYIFSINKHSRVKNNIMPVFATDPNFHELDKTLEEIKRQQNS